MLGTTHAPRSRARCSGPARGSHRWRLLRGRQRAPEPGARALLDRYIAAFENADPAALERVLRKDAALELVGSPTWFSGRDTCLRYVRQFFGAPGDWRMVDHGRQRAARRGGVPAGD